MIAMQYTIRLASDYNIDLVRERVARRKPLFDGLEGLMHKSYLFNPTEAIYAPFHVWQCDDAARDFLTGDLFRDLVETYGRPRVRCWGILAYGGNFESGNPRMVMKEIDAIAAETHLPDLASMERERNLRALEMPGLCFHMIGLDPDRWELMRYSGWSDPALAKNSDADVVDRFDVLQSCETVRPT